jgi:ribosome-binding ATPase YchF (GTP1/OBG family)
VHCDELVKAGSVGRARETGHYRIEGRDYVVRDGDVMLFRFNV